MRQVKPTAVMVETEAAAGGHGRRNARCIYAEMSFQKVADL
jgi:hypothetical protein